VFVALTLAQAEGLNFFDISVKDTKEIIWSFNLCTTANLGACP